MLVLTLATLLQVIGISTYSVYDYVMPSMTGPGGTIPSISGSVGNFGYCISGRCCPWNKQISNDTCEDFANADSVPGSSAWVIASNSATCMDGTTFKKGDDFLAARGLAAASLAFVLVGYVMVIALTLLQKDIKFAFFFAYVLIIASSIFIWASAAKAQTGLLGQCTATINVLKTLGGELLGGYSMGLEITGSLFNLGAVVAHNFYISVSFFPAVASMNRILISFAGDSPSNKISVILILLFSLASLIVNSQLILGTTFFGFSMSTNSLHEYYPSAKFAYQGMCIWGPPFWALYYILLVHSRFLSILKMRVLLTITAFISIIVFGLGIGLYVTSFDIKPGFNYGKASINNFEGYIGGSADYYCPRSPPGTCSPVGNYMGGYMGGCMMGSPNPNNGGGTPASGYPYSCCYLPSGSQSQCQPATPVGSLPSLITSAIPLMFFGGTAFLAWCCAMLLRWISPCLDEPSRNAISVVLYVILIIPAPMIPIILESPQTSVVISLLCTAAGLLVVAFVGLNIYMKYLSSESHFNEFEADNNPNLLHRCSLLQRLCDFLEHLCNRLRDFLQDKTSCCSKSSRENNIFPIQRVTSLSFVVLLVCYSTVSFYLASTSRPKMTCSQTFSGSLNYNFQNILCNPGVQLFTFLHIMVSILLQTPIQRWVCVIPVEFLQVIIH